jgi:hypothetical protein
MIVDDAFSRPVESATDYEFLLREQIVMQTIIGLQRDFRDLSFTVSFYAGSTEQRDHALGKRFPKGDARLSEWKGAPIVRTADVEDVRFLIGHRISMAVHPNVSILCRARDFAGVFSTDYDIDRFYVTDGDGTLLRYSLAAIRELDLRLVSDPMTDVWICAGTPEYLAAVRGAIVNGRDDLEILFPPRRGPSIFAVAASRRNIRQTHDNNR